MAQKKITDLTLRSSFDSTCNFPVDDGIQTWRTTGAQLSTFVKTVSPTVSTKTANYTALTTDDVIFCNTNAFTVTLPAATNAGKILRIEKIGSDSNVITISRAGSDTINGATSVLLTFQYDSVTLVADGSASWHILDLKQAKVVAKAFLSGAVSVSTTQPINFATVSFDPYSHITTGSAWKFTAKRSDYYRISATASAATSPISMIMYKNGISDTLLCTITNSLWNCGTTVVQLNVNEYIDLRSDAAAQNTLSNSLQSISIESC